MRGKTAEEVMVDFRKENEKLKKAGKQELTEEEITKLLPFKVFEGNRPINSILGKNLLRGHSVRLLRCMSIRSSCRASSGTSTALIGGVLNLAKDCYRILPQLEPEVSVTGHDPSTTGLINAYKKMTEGSARWRIYLSPFVQKLDMDRTSRGVDTPTIYLDVNWPIRYLDQT